MDEMEIPVYFICPISLQIMQDPVTTLTGITFDRHSIEQWLITSDEPVLCPVTNQPLSPATSDLTPNHILRRLIHAWSTPTPKPPLHTSLLRKLTLQVSIPRGADLDAVVKLDQLAVEHQNNHRCMAEAGVPRAMVRFILRSFRNGEKPGVEQALRTLRLLWTTSAMGEDLEDDTMEFIQSLLWILNSSDHQTDAITVLKNVIHVATPSDLDLMEKLNPDFFDEMTRILRRDTSPQAVIKSVLHILVHTCSSGRNRCRIVECGAVHELIELELNRKSDKKTTELVFSLLGNLCSCADGRQQLLKHGGGVAVVAKRLLSNTPATDEWGLCIIELIARFSARRHVVVEMLRVGVVTKLCMLLQADSAVYLKKKATNILRLHSDAWSNSSCMQLYISSY